VETAQLFTKSLTHPGETSRDPWKKGLEAPQTAATGLLVEGLAQWVSFVRDRWKEKSLLCAWPITKVSREKFFKEISFIILAQNKKV
jgi:hypothetical protein